MVTTGLVRLENARAVTGRAYAYTGSSAASTDKQAQDGAIAVNNYLASVKKWHADGREARRIAISNIPQLSYLAPAAWKMRGDARFVAALKARAGDKLGAAMLQNCQTHATDGLSDNTIATIAAAYDDYFAQPGGTRFNPQPGDPTRKYSFAWERLNQGTETTGQPDPAHPETTPLADVVNAYGLRGLYWYVKAVPSVTLIAVLKKAAPNWEQTPGWLRRLEPLTYFNVTQGDLDTAAGEVTFSNPVTHLGNLRGVAGMITGQTRAVAGGGDAAGTGDGTGGAYAADTGGIPWGTILVLLAIAGAVYWYFNRKKG